MNKPAVRPEEQTINFLFIIRHGTGRFTGDLEMMPAIFNNSVENAFKGEK